MYTLPLATVGGQNLANIPRLSPGMPSSSLLQSWPFDPFETSDASNARSMPRTTWEFAFSANGMLAQTIPSLTPFAERVRKPPGIQTRPRFLSFGKPFGGFGSEVDSRLALNGRWDSNLHPAPESVIRLYCL